MIVTFYKNKRNAVTVTAIVVSSYLVFGVIVKQEFTDDHTSVGMKTKTKPYFTLKGSKVFFPIAADCNMHFFMERSRDSEYLWGITNSLQQLKHICDVDEGMDVNKLAGFVCIFK